MDFFIVPTATFSLLYCFFITVHDRRRIFHFKVTHYPTSTWIVQQLREAFSLSRQPRFSSSITQVRRGGSVAVAANCWTTSFAINPLHLTRLLALSLVASPGNGQFR